MANVLVISQLPFIFHAQNLRTVKNQGLSFTVR